MPPTVSVLMTAYNREQFIADAIESVLAQTFADWELIISDDCSSDRTVEIARSYEARDSRIHVVVNDENVGQFPNRNRTAELATGRFIKFHDSDDLLYPHCLEIMTSLLTANPDASFALHPGAREWEGAPCPMLLSPRQCYEREYLGYGMFHVGPAAALFRRDAFARLRGFESLGLASDYAFWLRACKTESVLLVPGSLIWYRLHPGQEFASPEAEIHYAAAASHGWRALQSPDCPMSGGSLEQAKRNFVWSVGKLAFRDLTTGKWAVARVRFCKTGISFSDWVRCFRHQKRDAWAGTPANSDGSLRTPHWPDFVSTRVPR